MDSNKIFEKDKESVMQTYARFPVAIEHGHGATLYSPEGQEYIDFASGIGVNSLGYGNERWVDAITSQAKKLPHISNLFYSEPSVRLAGALTERTGMKNVFFSNSGAEANEGMIKLARKYSFDKYGKGRHSIITLKNSFHGRTITTLNATGQDVFHKYFFPFTEGFRYAAANDMEALKASYDAGVCAVMVELIQGEGGVYPTEQNYVNQLTAFCEEHDLLLLVDEVQTGVGRTGALFAYQKYGITPDAVSFAKGIAGGLPMGGFMAGEKTSGVLGAGDHATTFGGNPICSAAALAVLEQLDDALLSEVSKKGDYIRSEIEGWGLSKIVATRGMGLMIGAELNGLEPKPTAAVLVESGLLCITAGSDALRFLPPLVISYEEIDKGLKIMRETLSAI